MVADPRENFVEQSSVDSTQLIESSRIFDRFSGCLIVLLDAGVA